MKIMFSVPFVGRIIILLLVCAFSITIESIGSESNNSLVKFADDVMVRKVAEGVWLHTTYFEISELKNVPANGLIVISDEHGMMIDLPWTDEQTALSAIIDSYIASRLPRDPK